MSYVRRADDEKEDVLRLRSVRTWTLRVSALSVRKRYAPKPRGDSATEQEAYSNAPQAMEDQGGGDLHTMATKKKAKKPAKKAAKKKK